MCNYMYLWNHAFLGNKVVHILGNSSSTDDTCVVVELKPEELLPGKVERLYKDIMTYVKEPIVHYVGTNALPKYILVSAFIRIL